MEWAWNLMNEGKWNLTEWSKWMNCEWNELCFSECRERYFSEWNVNGMKLNGMRVVWRSCELMSCEWTATKPMSVNEWKRGAANRSMQFIQFASIDECMNEERRAQPAHFMKFNEMSGKRYDMYSLHSISSSFIQFQ